MYVLSKYRDISFSCALHSKWAKWNCNYAKGSEVSSTQAKWLLLTFICILIRLHYSDVEVVENIVALINCLAGYGECNMCSVIVLFVAQPRYPGKKWRMTLKLEWLMPSLFPVCLGACQRLSVMCLYVQQNVSSGYCMQHEATRLHALRLISWALFCVE